MKRLRGTLVRLAAASAMLLSSTVLAETVTLTMATWTPPGSAPFQSLRAWADEVEGASGGTLEIVFDETPLAPPPEQYDLVSEGGADLAYVVPSYTPERFPMMAAIEVPFMSPSAEVGSKALWEWYIEHVGEEEFADVKLITLWATVPGMPHSTREVRTLEDLQGMHTRVPGGIVTSIAEALGAVSVALSPGQVYEALQEGTIEAAFWDWNGVQDFNIAEVASYHLEIPDGLYTTPFVLVMNQESFESLSAEHQALLEDLGGASGAAFIGQIWDAMGEMGREAAIARGNVVEAIDPNELERWRERLAFLDEAWIAMANEQGYDGAALLESLRATIERHAGMENRTSIMDLGANASFYSSDGCIDTYVFVFANNWPYWFDGAPSRWTRFENSVSPAGPTTGTLISIYQYNTCHVEVFRHALGFAPSSAHSFQAAQDLASATLATTVEVFDYTSLTSYNVDVDLTWTSTSEISRGNGHWHYNSPVFGLSGQFSGSHLAAQALGGISDGAGNFTPEASQFAQLMRVGSGTVTLD